MNKYLKKNILGFHLMRHRQHRRFARNLAAPVLALGKARGMLLVGAVALAGEYLRRRKAQHALQQMGD